MGQGLRLVFSNSLKALEQGAFQEFCLSFLPLYHKRFDGLERHGGTAGGKTRKGTPDLLKTTSQGEQIAVQCSTEEDYWTPPADPKKKNWKPIKDITKCLEDLVHLKEIVLCSNREIPTSRPNIKSEVTRWAKARTKARITLFSISNFEQEIFKNRTKYSALIEQHLPELHAYSEPCLSHITLSVYRQRNAPLSKIEEIVRKTVSSIQEKGDIYSEVMNITSELKSRFQRLHPPEEGGVRRTKGLETLCRDTAGRVVGIVGIPKIGKTTWISQFCGQLDRSTTEVLWFDAPFSDYHLDDFLNDLARTILGKVFGEGVGNDFAEGKIYLDDISSRLSRSLNEPKKMIQVVVDNADNISSDRLKEIHEIFQAVRKSSEAKSLGIILIGNISLKSKGILLDEEFHSPSWDEEELSRLLEINSISVEDDLKKFCQILCPFSCGHPLIALAIARQASSIPKLLSLVGLKGPALFDRELTEEVKSLLFDDLLTDSDKRNLTLRVSPLIFPAKPALLSHLAEEIDPPLGRPAKLLIEQLRGAVLEGEDSIGYQISPVFRKVSQQYLTTDFILKIYRAAGGYLLRLENKTIDAMNTTDGISYAILGQDFDRAFAWACLLLFNAYRKLTQNQLRLVLSRLWPLKALQPPSDDSSKVQYAFTLFQMAVSFHKIGETRRVIELHRRILGLSIDKIILPDKLSSVLLELVFAVRVHLVINLAILGDSQAALRELDAVRVEDINPEILGEFKLTELAIVLIQKKERPALPKAFLLNQVETTRFDDEKRLGDLASCFCHIGVQIADSGNPRDILKDDKPCANPLWDLMVRFACAQSELEKKHSIKGIEILGKIESDVQTLGVRSNLLTAKITQMKGDALFQLDKRTEASQQYEISLHFLAEKEATFDRAWAHFRIGEYSESDLASYSAFSEACRLLEMLEFKQLASKAKGEMAVALYRKGNREEFLGVIEGLAREYYLKGSPEYGPSVAIGLALVTRLRAELEGKEHELAKERFPEFKKGVFVSVAEEARPNPGLCTAFYSLGETYELFDQIDRSVQCLSQAFGGKPSDELDSYAKVKAGIDLISNLLLKDAFDRLPSLSKKLLTAIEPSERLSDGICAYLIFRKNEHRLKQGVLSKASFWRLLDALEKSTEKLPHDRKHWWLAEVFKRKAGIDSITQKADYDHAYLRKSWECAKQGNNFQIITEVGHYLSFSFCEATQSIKELTDIQLSVVLGICHDQGDIKRLEILGSNLAEFWRKANYRRLKASELTYLHNLRDRAEELEAAGVPANLQPALMILFLLKVSGNMQNEKYRRAISWAFGKLEGNWGKIPNEERVYVEK